MRRDLYIGMVLSALVHFGSVYLSEHFRQPHIARAPAAREVEIGIETHPLPPEPPEILEVLEKQPKPDAQPPPPVIPDRPMLVTKDSFVTPVQQPPPEGFLTDSGVFKILQSRYEPGFEQLFNYGDVDQSPQPTFRAKAAYPDSMRRLGVEATVMVGFIVGSNGTVQQVHVISSTRSEFEASALKAVQNWKFKPGKKAGSAVNTMMSVPIVFRIKEDGN